MNDSEEEAWVSVLAFFVIGTFVLSGLVAAVLAAFVLFGGE